MYLKQNFKNVKLVHGFKNEKELNIINYVKYTIEQTSWHNLHITEFCSEENSGSPLTVHLKLS